jgi:hypothetical protein
MAQASDALHRGSREWSRKVRKAYEHRRIRHALHRAMRDAALLRFDTEDVDADGGLPTTNPAPGA